MTGDVSTQNGNEVIANAQWGSDAASGKTGAVSTEDLNTLSGHAGTQASNVGDVLGFVDSDKGSDFTNGSEFVPGYYVLIDQTLNLQNGDSKALPIIALLQKGEEFQISEKHDTVTAIKKVKENVKDIAAPTATTGVESKVDEKYNDTADYNIGDDVEYEFIASVPENIDKYDYYKYMFTDTLSKGLQLNNTLEKSIQVFIGDSESPLTMNYNVKVTTDYTGTANSVFQIDFGTFDESGNPTSTSKGLKDVPGVLYTADDEKGNAAHKAGTRKAETIKIKFSAKLTNAAVVTTTAGNNGNVNTMKLTYSSNPQDKTETKDTPDDSVIVFTYKLDFTKVDSTNPATKLEGAQFVIKNSAGKYATADSNGKLSGWLENEPTAVTPTENDETDYRARGVFISASDGAFGIQGLDDGTYTLHEIKAPNGYSIGQNHTFVITGKLGTEEGKGLQNWANDDQHQGLNAVTLKIDDKDAANWATANITNSKQSNLPETGGMGTVVLYTVGGLIVLIASVGLAVALRRRQA